MLSIHVALSLLNLPRVLGAHCAPVFDQEVLISAQEESFLKGRESVSQKRSL